MHSNRTKVHLSEKLAKKHSSETHKTSSSLTLVIETFSLKFMSFILPVRSEHVNLPVTKYTYTKEYKHISTCDCKFSKHDGLETYIHSTCSNVHYKGKSLATS